MPKSGVVKSKETRSNNTSRITPRNRAEARLQDAREFSSKTYNVGKRGSVSKKPSSFQSSSRGPSPYLKQQKASKIKRSKSSSVYS